ncbi:hypothetical protein AB833_00355 [Chromatiales bacterium (ex Bugula neritina AB1)]|nr:hypothetical protein AB833_00355 [Chromatiales bacterium (ex Bugula neritina AB1)]
MHCRVQGNGVSGLNRPLSVVWSSKEDESALQSDRALIFSLCGHNFAIPAGFVSKVGEVPAYTSVPASGQWFLGLVNHDGYPLPLVDARGFLLKNRGSNVPTSAIWIESAHGRFLLAVEQIITLADLTQKERQIIVPDTCRQELIEYACQHDQSSVMVIKLDKLVGAIVSSTSQTRISTGEMA